MAGQDYWDKTAMLDREERIARTVQPAQNSHNGQVEKDGQNKTAMIGLP